MYPQQGGYPQGSAAGGIGFQNSGPGYPGQPGGAAPYPTQGGGAPYPTPGFPQQQTNYPPQAAGYPPAAAGYPPQQPSGAYPPSTGYPSQQPTSGYPPQQPAAGYPSQQQQGSGYLPQKQQGGYPAQQQQGGYPAQQQQGGYPTQQQQGGYPPQQQQGGYPPQQQQGGYPQQQHGNYPPQQQGYPAPGSVPYNPGQPPYGGGGMPMGSGGYTQQQQHGYPVAGMTQQGGIMSNHSYQTPCQGTVKAYSNFNPLDDAQVLRKAMKGFGCDDKAVINVLCHRSNAQRQQIKLSFKTAFGKDLTKELIDELKGNLEDCIIALLTPTADFDAMQLRKAMEGMGTKESWLIEIMCSRTNSEINAIKEAYKRLYHRNLENDLSSETSGHFKRLLVSMSVGGRDETMNVNPQRAAQDAQALYKAGEKKMGTDESTFNMIMATQNFAQLQLIFDEYKKISKHDLEKAIQSEFSGDIEDGLLAVVKCARNRPAYFAERLYNSMKGLGTNDDTLIRCVVTRCEIDMVQIKQNFQKMFGKTLESFIAGDCSGKYKDALIALVK